MVFNFLLVWHYIPISFDECNTIFSYVFVHTIFIKCVEYVIIQINIFSYLYTCANYILYYFFLFCNIHMHITRSALAPGWWLECNNKELGIKVCQRVEDHMHGRLWWLFVDGPSWRRRLSTLEDFERNKLYHVSNL